MVKYTSQKVEFDTRKGFSAPEKYLSPKTSFKNDDLLVKCRKKGTGERMEAEQKRKKTKRFFGTQPKKKPSPGRMSQRPLAHIGDSVGRFRRYRCETLFNYHSNLSMCETFLQESIHLPAMCIPLRRNGKGTGREFMRVFTQSYGNGEGTGNFFLKKNLPGQPAIFFARIASESEKVIARILDEILRC